MFFDRRADRNPPNPPGPLFMPPEWLPRDVIDATYQLPSGENTITAERYIKKVIFGEEGELPARPAS